MRSLFLSLVALALVATGCAPTRTLATTDLGLEANAAAPVRVGDKLAVHSWTQEELSDTFAVDENGRVALPTLGFLPAAGIAAGRLQDSIRTAYAGVLRDPALRVIVLRRIFVTGEVETPGIYLADLTMGVSDAIAMAGGLTEAGDPGKILVNRGAEQIRMSQRDRSSYSLAGLRSGDEIVVRPRSFWARNPAVVVSTIGSAVSLVTLLVGYVSRL